MTASTPRSRTRSMSAGWLTVHTWTSLPAACASATKSGSARISEIPGPSAVALLSSSSRRTGRNRLPISWTVGIPGTSSAIRRTASWEKLIIRTAGRPAHSTGRPSPSRPNRRRLSTSASSTLRVCRVGCLVSIARRRLPGVAVMYSSSRSRVSTRPFSTSGSSVTERISSSAHRLRPRGRRAPNWYCSSSARCSAETTPRPLEVRRIRRSCTQTSTPSRVSRTSHSTASAPTAAAPR